MFIHRPLFPVNVINESACLMNRRFPRELSLSCKSEWNFDLRLSQLFINFFFYLTSHVKPVIFFCTSQYFHLLKHWALSCFQGRLLSVTERSKVLMNSFSITVKRMDSINKCAEYRDAVQVVRGMARQAFHREGALLNMAKFIYGVLQTIVAPNFR